MYLTLSYCDTRISPLGISKGLSYLILSKLKQGQQLTWQVTKSAYQHL